MGDDVPVFDASRTARRWDEVRDVTEEEISERAKMFRRQRREHQAMLRRQHMKRNSVVAD